MQVEQPHLFIYGVLIFVCIMAFSKVFSSAKVKLHMRAIAFALGLGFIVVPGHGEFIIAPVLACFVTPLRSYLIVLGCVFLLIWWAVSFALIKYLTKHLSRTR